MKNMKKKLMASIAMLVVSTILMTSTSYAWYTIQTKATVSDLEITLAQTKNVEIAKAQLTSDGSEFTMVKEVTQDDHASQNNFGASISYTAAELQIDLPSELIEDILIGTVKDASGNEKYYSKESGTDSTVKCYSLTSKVNVSGTDYIEYVKAKSAKIDGKTLESGMAGVVYGEDGRTYGFSNAYMVTDETSGVTKYLYKYLVTESGNSLVSKSNQAVIALSYNMFIRTNESGNIKIDYTKTNTSNDAARISISYKDLGVLGDSYKAGVQYDVPTGLSTASEDIIPATANHVYFVQVFAYIDGEKVTASDFNGSAMTAALRNITFSNEKINSGNEDWQDWQDAALNKVTLVENSDKTYTLSGLEKGMIVKSGVESGTGFIYGAPVTISGNEDLFKNMEKISGNETSIIVTGNKQNDTDADKYTREFTIPKSGN